MSDMINKTDVLLILNHQDQGWHDGISGDYHPYSPSEVLTNASRAINALPDVQPAPVTVQEVLSNPLKDRGKMIKEQHNDH